MTSARPAVVSHLTVAVVASVLAIAVPGAQAPERSKRPVVGPAPSVVLPVIQKRQLSNGLRVWMVEHHEVPVAQINLVVLSGSGQDPVGKYGVASLAAAMLSEGAGTRNALDLADAIDFLGADISSGGGVDQSTVRLHVPVARLADALPLMADVALRPTFPKDELERLRQQRLTGILQARDDAASIAGLAFPRLIYGPSHRYGTSALGPADAVKAFTIDDLRQFYDAVFRPDNAAVVAVGDFRGDALIAMLEKAFGGWKARGGSAPRIPLPNVPEATTRTVYLVDKPGAPQTQIRIGGIGVSRSTPDFFPIQVMNTILGGSFSSRLNLNLRETHGYTYGASSTFDMRSAAGPFFSAAGVQTDKTAESLTEFFNELNGILKPVPDEELTRAKSYVALRFPGSFETTGDISRRLEEALVYGLPDDYFTKYVANIEAVTAADVQRVAARYVRPDRSVVVVVGDRATIEPKIEALKLGPIKIVTIDDVFAAPAVR